MTTPLIPSELTLLQAILPSVTQAARQHRVNDFFMPYAVAHVNVARDTFNWGAAKGYFDVPNPQFIEVPEGSDAFTWDFLLYDYYIERIAQALAAQTSLSADEHQVLALICGVLIADEFGDLANSLEREVHFDGDAAQQALGLAIAQHQGLSLTAITSLDIVAVLSYLQARCLGQVAAPEITVSVTERLGVYKRWSTEKALVKRFSESNPQWAVDTHEKAKLLLGAYAKGENLFVDFFSKQKSEPPLFWNVKNEVSSLHQKSKNQIYSEILSRKDHVVWLEDLHKFTQLRYWSLVVEHSRIKPFFKDSPITLFRLVSDCLALGRLSEAKYLTELCKLIYERGRFTYVNENRPYPIYHWLLRLCFDYWDISFDKWGHSNSGPKVDPYAPGQCLGEPVLNAMFAIWRRPDLSGDEPELINLCDYYTWRTQDSDECEFSNDMFHCRYPAVILAWLRLRQQLGLSVPEIKHPLMQAPYAKLFEPVILPEDPLLTQVLQRLQREEIPHLFDASPSDKIFVGE